MRGERAPEGDGWRKATVGSAAKNRSYERIWCENCGHELIVSAKDLIEKHGVPPETPFWTLAQRLKCSACGSVKVGVMADSYRRERDHPDNRTDD